MLNQVEADHNPNAPVQYHSYELETLAVVETLKKFRSYLIGIRFIIVTDCNSLKESKEKKQLGPRIARWWLQLQEYTFDVVYRPGDRMKHVDALSRNPVILQITEATFTSKNLYGNVKIFTHLGTFHCSPPPPIKSFWRKTLTPK